MVKIVFHKGWPIFCEKVSFGYFAIIVMALLTPKTWRFLQTWLIILSIYYCSIFLEILRQLSSGTIAGEWKNTASLCSCSLACLRLITVECDLRLLLCVRNQRENGWPCISTSPMANKMMRPIWLYVISFTSLLSHFSLCNGYKLWPQTLETLSREAISKSNCYNCLCALQVGKKIK